MEICGENKHQSPEISDNEKQYQHNRQVNEATARDNSNGALFHSSN